MMRRLIPLFVAAVLVTVLVMALAGAALGRLVELPYPDAPPVRVTQVDTSNYPQVTVYVAANDPAGKPRPGLQQRDFSLTEDGAPVKITGFGGGGDTAVSTVLVIDRSGSMSEEDKIDGAQDAARTFVEQMRPGDSTALIAFNSRTNTLSGFTGDQADLRRTIERLRADGGTALYDAVIAGTDMLRNVSGRRVLLVLTDGADCREPNRCPFMSPGSRNSLDDAIRHADAQGQPVYVVGLGQRGGDIERGGIDEPVLRRIASETGGEYFYAPRASDLAALYARLAGNIHAEYSLTYVSPRPFYDGTRRDIVVSVGAASAASGYTERHLINVQSQPLVGLVLLVPLVGLLALPTLARRRGWKRLDDQPAPPAPMVAPASGAAALPQQPETTAPPVRQPSAITIQPGDVPRCAACDAPLRLGARFCGRCGATQAALPPTAAAGQRIFCDQCGRPLLADARFCTACGATAPVTR